MKINSFVKVLFVFLFTGLLIMFPILLHSQSKGPAPYQVIVYSAADFIGQSQSFVLNRRSHRILIVNRFNKDLDNKVSSIHVGSKVRAILFDHKDFHANWRRPSGGILSIYFKSPKRQERTELNHLFHNVGIYYISAPNLIHNDIYTSMIVIPNDIKTDWGVILSDFKDDFARVEPIPDLKKYKQRVIPDLGYISDKISALKFLGGHPGSVKLELFDKTQFRGDSISLPGMGSDKRDFILKKYNFKDRASSLKFTVSDPEVKTSGVSAPPADEQQTVVITDVIPIEKVLGKEMKPDPGVPQNVPGISGMWHDGHGNDYEFMQHGQAFSWFCPQRNEYGAGVFVGNRRIRVLWNNPKGSGQTNGKIIKVDPKRMAFEIKMDYGVTLYRK